MNRETLRGEDTGELESSLQLSDISTVNGSEEETDGQNNENNVATTMTNKRTEINFITTNARSLSPKINSLVDCFSDLDISFAIITESWLKHNKEMKEGYYDLELGEGMKIIHRSRRSNRGRNAGGGVAIVYDKDRIKLKEFKFRHGKSEIVCATGKLPGNPRPIAVIGVYISTRNTRKQDNEALECISNLILKLKK